MGTIAKDTGHYGCRGNCKGPSPPIILITETDQERGFAMFPFIGSGKVKDIVVPWPGTL